ncbi:MAG: hypothetical protein EBV34_21540 [Betaproteobacteria bacterium]|nr:hypothetical protein [Betaproteobacteria bacterium]
MRVGINGMGRVGRLALRAAMGAVQRSPEDPRAGNRLEVVHVNEIKGGSVAVAHLIEFDSVQGRWRADIRAEDEYSIDIDQQRLRRAGAVIGNEAEELLFGVSVQLAGETEQQTALLLLVAAPQGHGQSLEISDGSSPRT